MDGFTSAGLAGILYAEDFSDPAPPPSPAPVVPPPAVPPALTQEDVDAACIRAVAAAQRAWEHDASERRTVAMEALAAGLRDAQEAASLQAEQVAEGVARTTLGMVAAVLPELCRRHGDTEVRAMLRHVLPLVGRTGRVVVRVHAGLLAALEADLLQMDDEMAQVVELRAANLPEGDARLSWEDGGLVRDTAAIRAAVEDCLSQLGLLDLAIPEPRSLAHAQ